MNITYTQNGDYLMLRDILRSGVLMDIADVMDRTADGIQKSRAAPDGIVPVCHRLDVVDVHAVMDHLAHIVEEDCGDKRFAVCLSLLLDHGVEAADGVGFQPAHRAAAVKDKDDLG